MTPDLMYQVCIFIFGTIVGSFLNVCIVRLPQEKSVVFPASYCPSCEKPLKWYHNVPLISYAILLGKCCFCQTRISFRYFLVELLTGLIFLGFYSLIGMQWLLLPYLVMVSGFIVATFVDFEHRIIPDEISVGGMFVGFLFSLFFVNMHQITPEYIVVGAYFMRGLALFFIVLQLGYCLIKKKVTDDDRFFFMILVAFVAVEYFVASLVGMGLIPMSLHLASLQASIHGAFIGGGLIYFMGLIGDWIFKKESMGGGDVKLLAMIGAFLGWKLAILTFFLAPFFGAVVGIIQKIRTKESAIAYGPYICMAAVISLFWGNWIIVWVLNGYQIPG